MIDKDSYIPLAKQVEQLVERRIRSGEYPLFEAIPTQERLAGSLSVSRITVREALSSLAERGILKSYRGKGTFVSAIPPDRQGVHQLAGFSAQNYQRANLQTRLISKGAIEAGFEIATALECSVGSETAYFNRIRYIGDRPVSVERNYIHCDSIDNTTLVEHIRDNVSLYKTIAALSDIQIQEARESIEAITCDPDIQRHFHLSIGTPLLRVTRRTYSKNMTRPFEFTVYEILSEYYGEIVFRNEGKHDQ